MKRAVVVLATLAACGLLFALSHPHFHALAASLPHVRLHAGHLAHHVTARRRLRLGLLRHVRHLHRLLRWHRPWWHPFRRVRRVAWWLGF